jgi:hypothetical protein
MGNTAACFCSDGHDLVEELGDSFVVERVEKSRAVSLEMAWP